MPDGGCINRSYHDEERIEAAAMKLADDEWRRVDRWWATYNAALTGLLAWGGSGADYVSGDYARRSATEHADAAHGKLAKDALIEVKS